MEAALYGTQIHQQLWHVGRARSIAQHRRHVPCVEGVRTALSASVASAIEGEGAHVIMITTIHAQLGVHPGQQGRMFESNERRLTRALHQLYYMIRNTSTGLKE
jgi:hypothetical protein